MELEKHISSNYFKNKKIQLPENIKKIKIDVGLSFNAPISFEWLELEKDIVVFGFEPNLQNIEMIKGDRKIPNQLLKFLKKNNIRKYLGKRFFIIPYALSNKNGEQVFYNVKNKFNDNKTEYNHESGQSSLLRPKKMEYIESQVKVFNLYTFLSLIDWSKIKSITQIKIDAQGEDFKIIYGLNKFIKKVELISYEINAPGYQGYKNYKLQNIKMFFHMTLNGFYPFKKTHSEISYKNLRFLISKNNYYTTGN